MKRLMLILGALLLVSACQNSTGLKAPGAHCRLVSDLSPKTIEVCIATDGTVSAGFIE
jgi:hypothetical protein